MSLTQRTHSVPDGVILTVMPGNLSWNGHVDDEAEEVAQKTWDSHDGVYHADALLQSLAEFHMQFLVAG